jgi:hypothetical protein
MKASQLKKKKKKKPSCEAGRGHMTDIHRKTLVGFRGKHDLSACQRLLLADEWETVVVVVDRTSL